MAFCKYHPLQHATFTCVECEIFQCDTCVDEDSKRHDAECFICGKPLESLGEGHTVEPFWRRLEDAFRYPLNGNAITMMTVVAVGTAVLAYLPLLITFFLLLTLTGAMLKYSFKCLERTSEGEMTAPDITEAYSGGVALLFSLIAVIVLIGIFISLIAGYVGIGLATFVGFLAYVSFPAILIRFALTESIFQALNPLATFQLVVAIGLPYGVLVGLLLVMMGSVAFIGQLLGTDYSFVSHVLSSLVSNYYMIVSFHIMGYMLFQYQERLGYTARVDDQYLEQRSPADRLLAAIDVNIKEGEYEKAIELFMRGFSLFAKDIRFFDSYFNFIVRSEKAERVGEFAERYLQVLVSLNQYDKLNTSYKQIVSFVPGYVPDIPEARLVIARAAKNHGDVATVIKLVNGMHKKYPEFKSLPDAYGLMADALHDLPGKREQAQKCRVLAEQLKTKLARQEKSTPAATDVESARFDIAEPSSGASMPGLSEEKDILEVVDSDTPRVGETEHKRSEEEEKPKDLPPIEFKL